MSHHYPTITPHLGVDDAAAAIAFYTAAFGAAEESRFQTPDGTVVHAELRLGDALVTLGMAIPDFDLVQPEPGKPVHVTLTWFTADVDAAYARAVEAGCRSVSEPTDQFHGDRTCALRDPFGHRWVIATHLRDVPMEEQQAAFRQLMGG
ncbi:MAG: VOC family protein [Nocardioidaceae bacterium]|nr:VOC family protein [Nocardioidaceae bacterium]